MLLARPRSSFLSLLKKCPSFHSLSAGTGACQSHLISPAHRPAVGDHRPLQHYLQQLGICTTRRLLADSEAAAISSPLRIGPGTEAAKTQAAVSKPDKVQAVVKGIKQSPKKVNMVAAVVRGMRVEDALLQMQVTVKRAAQTVYKAIHSARSNATHNHGLNPNRLIVAEAFVGKGVYKKKIAYHAKGKSGLICGPVSQLTVVLKEMTAEQEAQLARLRVHRVHSHRKLTKQERRLVPHRIIESNPIWGYKNLRARARANQASNLTKPVA